MDSEMIRNIVAVQNREISVEAIAIQRLQRLERENPRVNAVVDYYPDELISQAKQIDGQIGDGKKLDLAGAVITVKDGLAVRGMHSTAGLIQYRENISDSDSDVVDRLRKSGALILGKTNMAAGALDVQTDNPVYGRTNHPEFPDRTCGGSSGGGACAVRLGISDVDVGYDLMGSIRIPAHFCGVYGFIPTGDAILADGITGGDPMGNTLGEMFRIGLQAKEVETIQYLLPRLLRSSFPGCISNKVEKLRIGWSEDCCGIPLSAESKKCFIKSMDNLALEHEIVPISQRDYDFDKARECFTKILYGAISANLPKPLYFVTRHILQNKLMNKQLKDFLEAENIREALIRQMEGLFEGLDCLIVPVSATPAFLHQKPDRMNGNQPIYDSLTVDGIQTNYATANLGFTTPFLTANPVISMPIGRTENGLPVGIQVVGGFFEDLELFEMVRLLAKAL